MREWIVTNGLGGYASLTHRQTATRKFHGLLVASLTPPTNRWVFVTNVLDYLVDHNKTLLLQETIPSFSFNRLPTLTYTIGDVEVQKTFFMDYGMNTSLVKYDVQTHHPVTFSHQPLVTSRHFYDCLAPGAFTFQHHHAADHIEFTTSRIEKTLKIRVDGASYTPYESWEELRYAADRERQDSWIDTVLRLGVFTKPVPRATSYYLTMTVEPELPENPGGILDQELLRTDELLRNAGLPEEYSPLVLASDQFLVQKGDGISMVAGYHWFSDWGRDTLIALPGTTLVTHRYYKARQLLLGLAGYCQGGLIPNVFMDRDGTSAYNTVDASLWFIDRAFQYLKYTNDLDFLFIIWPTLTSIIQHYIQGTRYGIHMDTDFLISHEPGLTWMDVKMGDYYPTPRAYKAVEIQGLWYNALRIMGVCAPLLERKDTYSPLAKKVHDSFHRQYDQMYDVVDKKDLSRRPNEIFLVSLDFPLADEPLQEEIVDEVQDHLITLFGPRTLAADDPAYKGSLIGPYNKDLAYHNGIVWPWLLGPFITAFVKTHDYNPSIRALAKSTFFEPMREVFGRQWDGTVPELFDPEPPYAPQGCITQAWSIAEILRALVEDIEGRRPEFEKTLLHEVRV